MRLSEKRALDTARRWAWARRINSRLTVTLNPNDSGWSGRRCTLVVTIGRDGTKYPREDFVIARLHIRKDGSCTVLEDNTLKYNERIQAIGDENERRFFEAFANLSPDDVPSWFIRIQNALPDEDLQGIDAIAVVSAEVDTGRLFIPIQIKSSHAGARKFFERYPYASNIVMVIVRDEDAATLRRHTLKKIARIRQKKIDILLGVASDEEPVSTS